MKHTFIVTVECEDYNKAMLVIQERLEYDEDYGFPYSIEWKWK